MPYQNETKRHADLGRLEGRMREAQDDAYPVVSREDAADASRGRRYVLVFLIVLAGSLLALLLQ
ncbi:hypothetical protein [Aurantimonas sp. HBX-1]|uniref:hypothetical protein n=1 Tax=Aurantimonas sp. HBX-1 TaxID=2906072 RepID=UPI001F381174|nr:hypothetical protein [Aurantimonas sp. HBX-1]UIJ73012.1 hypothetical protein LXB15_05015 [Aurantimonas sp. HBX-1]